MPYCLRSLVQTLEQILHHKNWVLAQEKIPQIQSLLENATFLRDFLDESSPPTQERVAGLEDLIMATAEKAEDSLESHITSQILSSPEGQSFTISPPDLGEIIKVFEVAKQEVIKILDAGQPSENIISPPVLWSRDPNSKDMVVGVTEDLIQLKSRLTARSSKLDIIPIVGMGGTGKTTLARILYDEHSSNKSYFDCCAWVTLSQSYSSQLILQTLLAFVHGKPLNDMPQQETGELIVSLYKSLFSRRYLIVLDDIWSCKAWDEVQMAFPKDNQGSRIILTTRESIVADYVKSNSHQMHLISIVDSWELLCRKVFGEESCPSELEEVGKRIAINCGGLPLALQVIGGLLSQSQRSKDSWEHVEYNVNSLIAKTDDRFSGIFSWSFAHLPHYLKPCFLYMGAFPEDHAIQASKVIKMWVAEGFLYPIRDKSLEEAAELHLNALVERNLIFVRERKDSGKVKSYGIHDLLRDLCLKKAEEKKFLFFKHSKAKLLEDTQCLRRVSVHASSDNEEHFLSLKLTSLARSFQLSSTKSKESYKILSCLCFESSLLRVLDVFEVNFHKFPEQILQLVNLRYLAIDMFVPRSISTLRNLQTLIAFQIESIAFVVDMPQLRHLYFNHLKIIFYDEGFFGIHENLRTLSNIPLRTLSCLLGKLPNLRELEIQWIYSDSTDNVVDLTCFSNLETLKCYNGFGLKKCTLISTNIIFPDSLKKLTLDTCTLPQALLDAIGLLPNLQVLNLEWCEFESTTWEPVECGFYELQYLRMESCWYLENWLATEFHFPVLQHLFIQYCHELKEIPSEIGAINTLETMEVQYCRLPVLESARRILEEQLQFGNTLLKVQARFQW